MLYNFAGMTAVGDDTSYCHCRVEIEKWKGIRSCRYGRGNASSDGENDCASKFSYA